MEITHTEFVSLNANWGALSELTTQELFRKTVLESYIITTLEQTTKVFVVESAFDEYQTTPEDIIYYRGHAETKIYHVFDSATDALNFQQTRAQEIITAALLADPDMCP